MIHRRTHPTYVEGCDPCRWATVSVGTVPGGARDERIGASFNRQREKDLNRYRDKRRAGEQPDGTTREAMDRYDRRIGSWEKAESKLREDMDAGTVKQIEKTTLNKK